MVRLGEELAEGKTKIVYAHPTDAALCYLVHKDGITAGDGAKRHTLPGKGVLAGRTTANVFRLLEKGGGDYPFRGYTTGGCHAGETVRDDSVGDRHAPDCHRFLPATASRN